jgi:hypothetical protein
LLQIHGMKNWYLLFLLITSYCTVWAQKEVLSDTILKKYEISAGRRQLHLMVERELKRTDISDGVYDKMIDVNGDIDKSAILSNALFTKSNRTLAYIENNETDDLVKRKYIGRVLENIKIFNTDYNDGYIDVSYYASLFENTYQVIRGIRNKNLTQYVKGNIGKPLYVISGIFENQPEAMTELMKGLSDLYPELLLKKIATITPEIAADVVVEKAAPRNPKAILNYATSTAKEREIVRRNKSPYVRSIITIADSAKTPLKAIFFIEEYIKGKTTIAEINTITENEDAYFKKLIEMRQTYFTSALRKSYDRELAHESARYVTSMNELHDQGDAVRFRIVDKLNAAELYYVIVYGSDDLYTSSFLGCYNRLMNRIKPKNGAEFLAELGMDKFRTFLRLCANYNTMGNFLSSMPSESKTTLMRDFVTDLDHTLEGDLEGATDVANSFGSIQDSTLMANIVQEIKVNRDKRSAATNARGFHIYDILFTMLTYSSDSLSAKLGIPPITSMPYAQLVNPSGIDSGAVVQQVFFYGDVDGKGVFNSYVNGFGGGEWKITREEYWVRIASLKGKPVVIYANKPLDEPDDERAQNILQDYLDGNNIKPSVIIHRGHSYHLSGTLDHIYHHHKVVILGACGAYQNLSTVLTHSEDAQIVSTKQIGSGRINGPIIRAFNQRLLEGKDINWVELWAQLAKQFPSGEMKNLFDDYVPPYKNLGALFLKAYNRSFTE